MTASNQAILRYSLAIVILIAFIAMIVCYFNFVTMIAILGVILYVITLHCTSKRNPLKVKVSF